MAHVHMHAPAQARTQVQQLALRGVPPEDMLVDPAALAGVLEEPRPHDAVSPLTLVAATIAAIVPTIIAVLWWAASHG